MINSATFHRYLSTVGHIVMGHLFSTNHILDEEMLTTYAELTYLRRDEILAILKRLDDTDPGKIAENPQHRFTVKQIGTILPQIKHSPFHDSICRVFSSKRDGHLGLEDVLDLCSAFSGNAPENVRAAWAFRIFDLDGDNEISANDLIEIVRRLTRNEENEHERVDTAVVDAERVAQLLFRHGDRTPGNKETYPKLPLNPIYETLGYGQLTEVGKMRAYHFGKMLRQRYDQFLGKGRHGDVYAISTDYDRTKVSLQLVLNGLYPSATYASLEQIGWSPVPTRYFPLLLDTVLCSQLCPTYVNEWEKIKRSDTVEKKLSKYNDLFEYLSKETDLSRDDPLLLVARLYQLLISQRSMNITLPEWASEDVQKRMEEIVSLDYEIQSFTTQLKRLNGGAIVKRFIEDIRNRTHTTTGPKIYLYSGHDINIAGFAKVHDFSEPRIPTYGYAIVVEILKTPIGTRFIRMYRWNGITEQLIPYNIPKCLKNYCPLEHYIARMQHLIPTDQESECLWDTMTLKNLHDYYRILEY